jgi:hypothetical protein
LSLSFDLAWYAVAPLIVYPARLRLGKAYRLGLLCVTSFVSTIWVWQAQRGHLDFLYAGALAKADI